MSSFNPWDHIRVVNLRGDPEYMANDDEKVISSNRTAGAVLGNPFIVKNRSMSERDRVIKEFGSAFQEDLTNQGPMWQICQNIADDILKNNVKIALSCYCTPAPCHLHQVVPVIVKMIEQKMEQQNSMNNSIKKVKP